MAASPSASRWQHLVAWLFGPEPAVSLAVFRMLWGGLMAWESWRYLAAGWVHRYYVEPTFLFKYAGFEWVPALGGPGMTAVSVVMIVSGVLVAIGLAYRAASAAFFVTHTYVFLLGAANYLNHAYLIALLAGYMILIPAHRTLSVDAWLRPTVGGAAVGRWGRALIQAQFGVVYIYGAIAKFNADWMVYHQPIRRWMEGSADRVAKAQWVRVLRLEERAHDLVASEAFTQLIAYGGVAFDLLVVPALLWKKTRTLAVLATLGFHLTNMNLFSIGVFPWLGLAATTLFFEPDWPRRLPKVGTWVVRALTWFEGRAQPRGGEAKRRGLWAALWVGWLAVQVLMPLRHHVYPGDVAWTEEGHYFSWRMKLRSKRGSVRYRVVDVVSKETWTVDPGEELSKRQARKIRGKQELIRQYANHLVRRYREDEGRVVEVYVDAMTSLNYRESQRFIDPQREIGHEPGTWWVYDWILPMQWTEPPHPGREETP